MRWSNAGEPIWTCQMAPNIQWMKRTRLLSRGSRAEAAGSQGCASSAPAGGWGHRPRRYWTVFEAPWRNPASPTPTSASRQRCSFGQGTCNAERPATMQPAGKIGYERPADLRTPRNMFRTGHQRPPAPSRVCAWGIGLRGRLEARPRRGSLRSMAACQCGTGQR